MFVPGVTQIFPASAPGHPRPRLCPWFSVLRCYVVRPALSSGPGKRSLVSAGGLVIILQQVAGELRRSWEPGLTPLSACQELQAGLGSGTPGLYSQRSADCSQFCVIEFPHMGPASNIISRMIKPCQGLSTVTESWDCRVNPVLQLCAQEKIAPRGPGTVLLMRHLKRPLPTLC